MTIKKGLGLITKVMQPSPKALLLACQQVVVVDGVIGSIYEQVLTVDAEPGGLGDVGRQDVDAVAGEHRDRLSELGPDHDGLAPPVPQVALGFEQVVDPWRSGVIVGESH